MAVLLEILGETCFVQGYSRVRVVVQDSSSIETPQPLHVFWQLVGFFFLVAHSDRPIFCQDSGQKVVKREEGRTISHTWPQHHVHFDQSIPPLSPSEIETTETLRR